MITITFILWKLFLPFLVLFALADWLTASLPRRVAILRAAGFSERAIAGRLNVTRYRVRLALVS